MPFVSKTVLMWEKDRIAQELTELDVRDLVKFRALQVENGWRALAILGYKVEAIVKYRDLTRCGLKEAKDTIEYYTQSQESDNLLLARTRSRHAQEEYDIRK